MSLIHKIKPRQNFIDFLHMLIVEHSKQNLNEPVTPVSMFEIAKKEEEFLMYRGHKMSPTKIFISISDKA